MGVEHAGTTPRLQLDPFWDTPSQEADTTSCMGCEACRQNSWVKVCPNAPQVRAVRLAWPGLQHHDVRTVTTA